MVNTNRIFGSLLLGCLVLSSTSLVAAEPADGKWETLFNGKDLTGWVPMHDVTCVVTNENLQLVKGMGWLRSEKEYGDFILECEWRALVEQYDSGFFIRCQKEGKPWPTDGWQINLRYNQLGGMVRGYKAVVPAEAPKLPVNKWVKFRIEVRGKQCTLFVDGVKAREFNELDRDRGFIGLQVENKAFDFRNIRLQELPAAK